MKNINNMTEVEQIAELKARGYSWFIAYISISNPSEAVQLEAVKRISYKSNKEWVDIYITAPKAIELYNKLVNMYKVIK